jgi:hypothetical protein
MTDECGLVEMSVRARAATVSCGTDRLAGPLTRVAPAPYLQPHG